MGIDIGGTFADVVAFRPASEEARQAKVRSRPGDPLASLHAALAGVDLDWDEVDDLIHGSTLVTNAIVEGRLAEVALVTTEGFTDTLAIGRQNRLHLYRLDLPPKAPPLVPEARRFGVPERLDADGAVLAGLDKAAIERVADAVAASGARAVAVSLLHAYANGEHERRLGERLSRDTPHVALSHRVSPEAREFERTSTTVLSAAVMPLASDYLKRLEQARPARSRLHLFHSAGGMSAPAALAELPLGLALSGPAAGVAAAGWVARELGLDKVISFDMGGTTTDVCLVVEGQAEVRADRALAGHPLRMPMVAVESIGAGGGSIARLRTGALEVGPDSAGAEPGPACYGLGGTQPTVSDANLVLGYIDAGRPFGDLRLDTEAALRAIGPLARLAGVSVPQAALGIARVTNAAMTRALRRVSVERGVDGRDCVLLAFGGAGPMHAVELARAYGIERVLVPRFSGVFSALGCVTAPFSYTRQQTLRMRSDGWDTSRLQACRADLRATLAAPFETPGVPSPSATEVAAIRYLGQSYAVEIEQPALDDPIRLGEQFRARHAALYGFATEEAWELVSLRVCLSAIRAGRPSMRVTRQAPCRAVPPPVTPCWFDADGPRQTPRHARESLSEGDRLAGPAIVEDAWSTVVLPPGATLEVDGHGHLHIAAGVAR